MFIVCDRLKIYENLVLKSALLFPLSSGEQIQDAVSRSSRRGVEVFAIRDASSAI